MEIFKFENSENKFPGNESLEMEKFDRLADREFGNLVISKFGKSDKLEVSECTRIRQLGS